jgi:hypothetical protein
MPSSPSPSDIRHDNQVVALGLMLWVSDRFRLFRQSAAMSNCLTLNRAPGRSCEIGAAAALRRNETAHDFSDELFRFLK